MSIPATLVLSDGSIFRGISVGYEGETIGEVVFNTAMTGYQEVVSDPSYAQQIVTLTYPHIGNVGTNHLDQESDNVWLAGLVVRNLTAEMNQWRSETSFSDYLKQNKVVAIAEIDTRRLTRILRDKGALSGCIATGENSNPDRLIEKTHAFSGIANADLAKEVSTKQPYHWNKTTVDLAINKDKTIAKEKLPYHVVVYDFGVKHMSLRLLVGRGCYLTVVPAKTPVEEVFALKPDGVFLSNGPGDPAACDYAISAIKVLLDKGMPLFGLCLGHQLLALASGARTEKMKFGHHGANHPVQELASKKVFITSQNHGFTVEEASLPAHLKVTHRSLFDESIQGLEYKGKPAFGFQGHPEAGPGPQDIEVLLDQFINSFNNHAKT